MLAIDVIGVVLSILHSRRRIVTLVILRASGLLGIKVVVPVEYDLLSEEQSNMIYHHRIFITYIRTDSHRRWSRNSNYNRGLIDGRCDWEWSNEVQFLAL